MVQCNKVCNPSVPGYRLTKDEKGKPVNATKYKQVMGSLMYLLATRPDLAYSIFLVERYIGRDQ